MVYKTIADRRAIYVTMSRSITAGRHFHICVELRALTDRKLRVATIMNYFPELQKQEPVNADKYSEGWWELDAHGMQKRHEALKAAIFLCDIEIYKNAENNIPLSEELRDRSIGPR